MIARNTVWFPWWQTVWLSFFRLFGGQEQARVFGGSDLAHEEAGRQADLQIDLQTDRQTHLADVGWT